MKKITLLIAAILITLLVSSCKKELIKDNPAAANSQEKALPKERVYTIKIGDQLWMIRNLNVVTYRNGDSIKLVSNPKKWSKLNTGAWCYYNNEPGSGAVYGKLYNWYAVNDRRGLAPEGWHIPSEDELKILYSNLGGEDIAGGALKSTQYWLDPNTGGTNSSGFTALPGGRRNQYGNYSLLGYAGTFWTSSENIVTNYAVAGRLFYLNEKATRKEYSKNYGFSVRCIKDY